MTTGPLVTIALAVYNAEKYLRETLNCICNQTYRNLDILCINDGSTDSSLAILEEFAAADPRIRIISQPNEGPASARNAAIDNARGKYLQMLDSDDIFKPDMVQSMLTRAEEQNAQIVVCGSIEEHVESNQQMRDMQTNISLAKQKLNLECSNPSQDAPGDFFQIFNWGIVWDKLFRMEFLRKHQFRFLGVQPAEDIPFAYPALIKATRVSIVESVFIHYQVRSSSLCHTKNRDIFQSPKSYKMLWNFMKEHKVCPQLEASYLLHTPASVYYNVNRANVFPCQIVAYIEKTSKIFPQFLHRNFSSHILHPGLCGYEALFCPEISLILPGLSPAEQPDLFSKVQQLVNDSYCPQLAVRILYTNDDGSPLPHEQLDFPIALPVRAADAATKEERINACRKLPLPAAAIEIWPGCNPAPILQLIRRHQLQLVWSRAQRLAAITAHRRTLLKTKNRILRKRIRSLRLLLDIIRQDFKTNY